MMFSGRVLTTSPTTCTPRLMASCGSGKGGVYVLLLLLLRQSLNRCACSFSLNHEASWPSLSMWAGSGRPRARKLRVGRRCGLAAGEDRGVGSGATAATQRVNDKANVCKCGDGDACVRREGVRHVYASQLARCFSVWTRLDSRQELTWATFRLLQMAPA